MIPKNLINEYFYYLQLRLKILIFVIHFWSNEANENQH